MGDLRIDVAIERWPLRQAFVISRGSKAHADVIVVTVGDGKHNGRGEAVPYARYGETLDSCVAAVQTIDPRVDRHTLQRLLPAGAARNALDCALWDLEAKRTGQSAATLAIAPLHTSYTLSLDTPDAMASAAASKQGLSFFKLKLGGLGDADRIAAVRRARPDARLIADANEAWTPGLFSELMAAARASGIEVIEQPLPADQDELLADLPRSVPICADESAHTAADIDRLRSLYDAVNIKLDKAGGLTAALEMEKAARAAGLRIMAGCMVSTSLAMAPATILAQNADWVDLDGPLLLARDREFGLRVDEGGWVQPPERNLWG